LEGCKIRKIRIPEFMGEGKVFRKFHYIICRISLNLDGVFKIVYLNINYTMIIVDKDWVKKFRFNLEIHRINESINVRDINTTKYFLNEFIILNFFIPGVVDGKIELIKITAEIYLMSNLKIKLLLGVNVLDSMRIDISFRNRIITIAGEDRWKSNIHVYTKDNVRIRRNVRILK